MANTQGLEPCAARLGGSSPPEGIIVRGATARGRIM